MSGLLEWLEKIGEEILKDDEKDVGKLDRPHHWQAGLGLMILSALGQLVSEIEKAVKLIEKELEE